MGCKAGMLLLDSHYQHGLMGWWVVIDVWLGVECGGGGGGVWVWVFVCVRGFDGCGGWGGRRRGSNGENGRGGRSDRDSTDGGHAPERDDAMVVSAVLAHACYAELSPIRPSPHPFPPRDTFTLCSCQALAWEGYNMRWTFSIELGPLRCMPPHTS